MKKVNILRFKVTVESDVHQVDEFDAIIEAMELFCQFEFVSVEPLKKFYEIKIISEESIETKTAHKWITRALLDYCKFKSADVKLIEEHNAVWVNDDYSLGAVN